MKKVFLTLSVALLALTACKNIGSLNTKQSGNYINNAVARRLVRQSLK